MDLAFIILNTAGGLALFLYGMVLINNGLQKAAGEKTRRLLYRMTDKPLKGVVTGAVVTAVIQSSSVTTVMLVTMVNAGVMSLQQAAGVIFGSNIGTTITAQIVAFKIGLYALPLILSGFLIEFFARRSSQRYLGQILLGSGFIFLGMIFMDSGVKPLQNDVFFMTIMTLFGDKPIWGIITGTVFTGIVQASSATIALVITLAMEGMITLQAAVPILLGANIGTCVTALIASIGTSRNAKRVSVIHLMFNVIGVSIFFFPLAYFIELAALTAPDVPRQIANAHTIFNLITTLVLLPFISTLILISKKMVPGEEYEIQKIGYLDKQLFKVPSLALEQATNELNRMATISLEMLSHSERIIFENNRDMCAVVLKGESATDEMHHSLDRYLTELSNVDMNEIETKKLARLVHLVTDIERVADHIKNISEIGLIRIEEGWSFSTSAVEELKRMFDRVQEMYRRAMDAFLKENKELAAEVIRMDTEIDLMDNEYTTHHIERLERNICVSKAGILFVDLLRNLERIADHADNIADSVVFGF